MKNFVGHPRVRPVVDLASGEAIDWSMFANGEIRRGKSGRLTQGFIVNKSTSKESAALVVVADCACKTFDGCPLGPLMVFAGTKFDSITIERRKASK